jgi:hypothetical protein
MIAKGGNGETQNIETEVVPVKIGGGTLPESPPVASPPTPMSTPTTLP